MTESSNNVQAVTLNKVSCILYLSRVINYSSIIIKTYFDKDRIS